MHGPGDIVQLYVNVRSSMKHRETKRREMKGARERERKKRERERVRHGDKHIARRSREVLPMRRMRQTLQQQYGIAADN